MGCQKAIAQKIIQQKGDYILALKGNHSGLQAELEAWWHKEQITTENYADYTETDNGCNELSQK